MKKSCKGSSCIGYLEEKINEIDFNSDLSRNGKFNRAIIKANSCTVEELKLYARDLKKFKSTIPTDVNYPTALQVAVDENIELILEEVEKKLKTALELTTLQTRYEIEILWFIYLSALQNDVMQVGGKTAKSKDLTGPEMVKRLVELLMLNREQDKDIIDKIKTTLLEWKSEVI